MKDDDLVKSRKSFTTVITAKAGIRKNRRFTSRWTPAFSGVATPCEGVQAVSSRGARRPALPLLGLFFLLPLIIAWADSWEGLREASGRITSVEARFVQKKTLPMLTRPFVSEGRFFYQAPGQLRWEYERPVRSVLLMNGGEVRRYLREPGGWREETGASLTAMRVVMEEIANWQQGRFDANPHFQATLSTDPETKVTLLPKEASWGKMIRRIELTLSREQAGVMKGVRIVEDERSFTDLSFSQVRINRPLPASLFVNTE